MDGIGIAGAIRRHFYVFVVCLMATLVSAVGVYLSIPRPFLAQTQLVLLAPDTQIGANGKQVQVNPWQGAGDNASQVTASALSNIASSPSFAALLAASGVTSTSSVAVSTSGGGVILDVATVNRVADEAESDLVKVVARLRDTLFEQQRTAGAPSASLLRLADLTGVAPPVAQAANRTKLAGVAAVLGLLVTLGAVIVVDGRSRRRPREAVPPKNLPAFDADDDAESASARSAERIAAVSRHKSAGRESRRQQVRTSSPRTDSERSVV